MTAAGSMFSRIQEYVNQITVNPGPEGINICPQDMASVQVSVRRLAYVQENVGDRQQIEQPEN